jgi:hypothetical protein
MSQDPCSSSLIAPVPLPPGAEVLGQRVRSFLEGQSPYDASVAEAFKGMEEAMDFIAASMYNLASMLLGEGEECVTLVEKGVAAAGASICQDAEVLRRDGIRYVCSEALRLIESREPGALSAPDTAARTVNCLDGDDLEGAGISRADLDRMMEGPERVRVRAWLEGLPAIVRVVFAMRVVGGFCGVETAKLLAEAAGGGWTPEAVSEIFRQGLCSLASQLLHASAAR